MSTHAGGPPSRGWTHTGSACPGPCPLEPGYGRPLRTRHPAPGGRTGVKTGPWYVRPEPHTGRSPNDKFVVKRAVQRGPHRLGQGQSPDRLGALRGPPSGTCSPISASVNSTCRTSTPARIPAIACGCAFIHELAWQNLFVRNLFIVPPAYELADFRRSSPSSPCPVSRRRRNATAPDPTSRLSLNMGSREVLIAGHQLCR